MLAQILLGIASFLQAAVCLDILELYLWIGGRISKHI